MAEFDLFLSYASADLAGVEALEAWLRAEPRTRTIWRDRRGILPGAPDFYPPIHDGIAASAAFLLVLSPRWLRSTVCAQELTDAHDAGKKIVVVVHPAIARDPSTAEGRERKVELFDALRASSVAAILERRNWIWPRDRDDDAPDYDPVDHALATDFAWAARHAVIVQRLNRWKEVRDDTALVRGSDLVALMADAFADAAGREPVLTDEQRAFLLDSQRHDAAERERVEGLYWGAQARAAAFAAQERGEAEPDLALLLAAESASVATVPEARATLLGLLDRHAMLTAVLHGHTPARHIAGLAFSRDGRWLASIDRARAINDDRRAYLLIHDATTGRQEKRVPGGDGVLTAVAWGARWLAVASRGSIGWLYFDEWKDRFRGNSPTPLGDVSPDFLAFSPPGATGDAGECLAWATQWGDIGLIRVGDHGRTQRRVTDTPHGDALTGLAWLADGRLLTAESGTIRTRPFPDLGPARDIVAVDQVFALAADGSRWVAGVRRTRTDGAGAGQLETGLLLGDGDEVVGFVPGFAPDIPVDAVFAATGDDAVLLASTSIRRSGAPAVALIRDPTYARQRTRQHAAARAEPDDPTRDTARADPEIGAPRHAQADDDARSATAATLLHGEDVPITAIAASPGGRMVAAGDAAGRVWLWDRARRSHLVREAGGGGASWFSGRGDAPAGLRSGATHDGDDEGDGGRHGAGHAPGRHADSSGRGDEASVGAAASGDGSEEASNSGTDPDDGGGEASVIVRSDGVAVWAALFGESTIRVYRGEGDAPELVATIPAGAPVVSLAVDPAGQRVLAVVSRLGLDLLAWRIDAPAEAPAELAPITSGLPPVPIAFPSAELVAIGDGDDIVFLPLDDPQAPVRRSGHDEPIRRIAAGGGLVASLATSFQNVSADQVRLWTAMGQPLGSIALAGRALDLAISPDGTELLIARESGGSWRVGLAALDWIAAARRVAGRALTAEEERRFGVDAWRARAAGAEEDG